MCDITERVTCNKKLISDEVRLVCLTELSDVLNSDGVIESDDSYIIKEQDVVYIPTNIVSLGV